MTITPKPDHIEPFRHYEPPRVHCVLTGFMVLAGAFAVVLAGVAVGSPIAAINHSQLPGLTFGTVFVLMFWYGCWRLRRTMRQARELQHAKTQIKVGCTASQFTTYCTLALVLIGVAAGLNWALPSPEIVPIPKGLATTLVGLLGLGAITTAFTAQRHLKHGQQQAADEAQQETDMLVLTTRLTGHPPRRRRLLGAFAPRPAPRRNSNSSA